MSVALSRLVFGGMYIPSTSKDSIFFQRVLLHTKTLFLFTGGTTTADEGTTPIPGEADAGT
ncbi:hypothetical protein J6590_000788 [Homalodisca vitripennis]|nr:hypothetical protein J6590_000788 [Homalodisca vitripennis]